MTNKKRGMNLGITGIMALFLISSVSAFAVSSQYYEGNPLRMAPGDVNEFSLALQNPSGDSDLLVSAAISGDGADIATLDGEEYVITPDGERTLVPIKITMPEDTKYGQIYDIIVTFTTIQTPDNLQGGFGSSIAKVIPVERIDSRTDFQKRASSPGTYIIIVLVLIAIAVMIIAIRKKNAK